MQIRGKPHIHLDDMWIGPIFVDSVLIRHLLVMSESRRRHCDGKSSKDEPVAKKASTGL